MISLLTYSIVASTVTASLMINRGVCCNIWSTPEEANEEAND